MSERKAGWYWCVMDGALFPIYYSGATWWKGGHKLWEEPRIVSGRIPTPEEPWQCVPAEPTIEMLAALGWDGDVNLAIGHGAITGELEGAYAAMLAVAPKPEGS